MASIADIFFTAGLDDAQLQVDAKRSGQQAGTTLGSSLAASVKKSWGGEQLGKGLIQGLGLAGGLGAANLLANGLGAVTQGITDSIDAASDLNETVSKGRVIFGRNADEMEAWAATGAKAFGQSKRAALDVASTFAGLFSTVGLALDDATDKSRKLTELGSDLASFFNTDVKEATDALRSGLSGESEPLRRFNIFLSETAVAAKAAQLGMKKVNGQFTEGQKVTARYAIIMEQSSAAQGDFARTSDGLANSEKAKNAELENAEAIIGQRLLPLQKAWTQFIRDVAIPALVTFTEVIAGVGDAAAAIADPFVKAGGAINDFIRDLPDPHIGDTFGDFIAKDTARIEQESRTFGTSAGEAIGFGILAGLDDKLKALGPQLNDGTKRAIRALDGDAVRKAVGKMFGPPDPDPGKTLHFYGLKASISAAQGIVDGIHEKRGIVDTAWEDLVLGLTQQLTPVQERARLLGRLASTKLRDGLKSGDPAVKAQAQLTRDLIISRLDELRAGAKNIGEKGMEALRRAMKSKDPAIRAAAQGIYRSIKNPINPAITNAFSWGSAIGRNLKNGLLSQAGAIGSAAGLLANIIADYLQPGSPTKLGPLSKAGGPEGFGQLIGAEITAGVASSLPGLNTALADGIKLPPLPTLAHAIPSMRMQPVNLDAGLPVTATGRDTYNITANVEGLVKARNPLEIARQLQRFAKAGTLAPKPEPA